MNLKQLIIAFALYKLVFAKKPARPPTDSLVQPYPERGDVFIEGGPSNPEDWEQWNKIGLSK